MIVDKLLLILCGHGLEWVEFPLKISFEVLASLNDLVHNLKSLLLGNSWSEWEISKVSSNSDSSRVDHGRLLGSEFEVLQLLSIHVGNVLIILLVLVIVLNDLIEKLLKLGVSLMRSGVDTDSGILVGNTGENASLKTNTSIAFLILVLFPDFLGKTLLKLGLALWGEEGVEVLEGLGGLVLWRGFHLFVNKDMRFKFNKSVNRFA